MLLLIAHAQLSCAEVAEKITEERVGGEGSALESLTFEEIPTEPVDIQFTQ